MLLPGALLCVLSYAGAGKRSLKNTRWGVPLALRLMACIGAALIAAGFSAVTNLAPLETVVLADASDSMGALRQAAWEDGRMLAERTGGKLLIFAESAVSGQGDGLKKDATDLEGALKQAARLFSSNARKRIVVLSDGLETDGSAQKEAARLQGLGIRVDGVQYAPWENRQEVEAVSVSLPQELALGQTAKAAVTLRTDRAVSIRLKLYDDEEAVYENKLTLKQGQSTYTVQVTPSRSGTHTYRAVAEPEADGFPQNNEAACCMQVTSSARILLVDGTGKESGPLESLLLSQGYSVDTKPPKEIPPNVASLCKYGLVILLNTDAKTLPPTAAEALKDYVERYGRSVLAVGGENTFAYGHMYETAFEDFLPVTVRVEREESAQPVALLLLIDNSASMGESTTSLASDFGRPMEMAKLGAIKSVSLLHENDSAGVISFSNKAHLLCPLQPVTERDSIIAAISRMGLISGTMYTEAFAEALTQFAAYPGQEKKHIIFLSDGSPSDDGYMPVVRQLGEMGVTVSTIAVGSQVNREILQDIADAAGGRFAQVTSVDELPNLMTSDTILQQVDYTVEGPFAPLKSPQYALFSDVDLPQLGGYIRVSPKEGAETVLLAEAGRPLYVQWQYGTGQAACFASDLSGKWSQEWLETEAGREAILRLLEALLPQEQDFSPLNMALIPGGREALLTVSLPDAQPGQNCQAVITGLGGNQQTLPLIQTGSGAFARSFPLWGLGRYDITLYQYAPDRTLLETSESAAYVSRSREYEAFPTEEETALLGAVCAAAGGELYKSAEDAGAALLSSLTVDAKLTGPLALVLGLAVIGEQLLRRRPLRRKQRSAYAHTNKRTERSDEP